MPGGIDFTPGRVADLIGKKVGVNRGGIGEYLLAKALAQNGISLDQMEKTYLGPADGAYAFSTCNVDALAVWDPTSRLPRCATRPGDCVVARYRIGERDDYGCAQRLPRTRSGSI